MSLPSTTRRGFCCGAAGGFFAYALRAHGAELFTGAPRGTAKRAVVLWMNGGPSHIDTFDPKPGGTTGGPFKAIETAAEGLRIGEHLPLIAQRLDRLSVIRSLTSREGDHLRATHLYHTGYPLVDGFARPASGSVVSFETPEEKFPKFVTVGSVGVGPAYLGADNGPFGIEDAAQALKMMRAVEKRRDRLVLMRELGREFDEGHPDELIDRRNAVVRKIEELLETPFTQALDLDKEPAASRERYGATPFGRGCLLARRLLEAGVRFVEVRLDGWDTHQDNFNATQRLCGALDRPWATLMDDLAAGGLLDDTVVLWMGEFGRTPTINAQNGRDHYPQVTAAVIGGGGIPGGRVVGETDAQGAQIARDPVAVPDLFATLYGAFGIEPDKKYRTDFGGTATSTDGGKPIEALR